MGKILLTLLTMFLWLSAFGQGGEKLKIRHIKGFKSVEIGQGVTLGKETMAYTTYGAYNHFFSKRIFVQGGLNFEYGEIGESELKNIYGQAILNHTYYLLNDVVFFNIGAGLFCGNESSKSLINDQSASKFIYGGVITINAEVYLSNLLSVCPYINQRAQISSEMGTAAYNMGLSLKLNLK